MHIREWVIMLTLHVLWIVANVMLIVYLDWTWLGVLAFLFLLIHLVTLVTLVTLLWEE